MVWFGEGEGAGLFQLSHYGQPSAALFFTAEHVDTAHGQVGVDSEEGVDGAVDAPHFARHDAYFAAAKPGASVALDEGSDDTQFA